MHHLPSSTAMGSPATSVHEDTFATRPSGANSAVACGKKGEGRQQWTRGMHSQPSIGLTRERSAYACVESKSLRQHLKPLVQPRGSLDAQEISSYRRIVERPDHVDAVEAVGAEADRCGLKRKCAGKQVRQQSLHPPHAAAWGIQRQQRLRRKGTANLLGCTAVTLLCEHAPSASLTPPYPAPTRQHRVHSALLQRRQPFLQ